MKRAPLKITVFTAAFSMMAGLFLVSLLGWLDDTFGAGLTINAVIDTITSPVKGANVSGLIIDFILTLGLPLIVFTAYCFLLNRAWMKRGKLLIVLALLPGFIMLGYAADAANRRYQLAESYARSISTTTIYNDYYHKVAPDEVVFPKKKRNVILILLESVEDTFNDEEYFGEKLMPGLYDLQQENLSFSGHRFTVNSDWTYSALTSYFYGVPKSAPISLSRKCVKSGDQDKGAPSLLSIFERNGYEVEYIQGSDAAYSDKDALVSCHLQNPNVYDLSYFLANDKSAQNYTLGGWGLPDSFLYAWLKSHLTERRSDKPFFTVLLTVNTHVPEEVFENAIQPKYGDYRDVIREADFLATDFVTWFRRQSFAEDTTLIITGDHQFCFDTIGNINMKPRAEREVFNVFLNASSALPSHRQRGRVFSSVDLAPTILESAGAKLPEGRLGLGFSLFRPELKTIFETRGVDWYNEEILKKGISDDTLYHDQEQARLDKLSFFAALLLILEVFIISRRRRRLKAKNFAENSSLKLLTN